MRPGGATVARLSPVQKVACSKHIWVNYFISFLRVDAFGIISVVIFVPSEEILTGGLVAQR